MTQHTPELIRAAIRAAREQPLKSHWGVAKDFGISDATLHRWLNAPRASLNPTHAVPDPDPSGQGEHVATGESEAESEARSELESEAEAENANPG